MAANAGGYSPEIQGRRQAGCGRCLIDGAQGVEIRALHTDDGPNVYPAGLQTCGSTWLCPVCAAKIRARRAVEVQLAAMTHTAAGGTLVMLTQTLRHNRTQSLDDLVKSLRASWQTVQQHRQWRPIRAQLVGMIVALEVTFGPNGWHPHLHVLLFLPAGAESVKDDLEGWLPEAWAGIVGRKLGVSPDLEHGTHLKVLDAGASAYVSKIGDETARGDLKSDSTNPFSLLDGVGTDPAATAKWLEYSKVMKGKRSLRWTPGLKDLLLPDVDELTDEELAAMVVDGEHLETLPGATWRVLMNGQTSTGVVSAVRYLEQWERRLRLEKQPLRCPESEQNEPRPWETAGR
jgi:hypothetical protein